MTDVQLDIVNINNWKPWLVALANQAAHLMKAIINDNSENNFITRVRNETFTYRGYFNDSKQLTQISSNEISNLILGGKETFQPANNVINLKVDLKALEDENPNDNLITLGYVDPPYPLITTNLTWINTQVNTNGNNMDPLSLAAHWLHEWLHVAGMRHLDPIVIDEEDAVYKIGYILISMVKERGLSGNNKFVVPFSSDWGNPYIKSVKASVFTGKHSCGYQE